MAPSRIDDSDEDDPVTAEYSVFITPAAQQQLLLLQYPNRAADRPYSDPSPSEVRLKPKTGHLELDIPLLTNGNFNKYQALKWGSSLHAHNVNENTGTYGIAGGLTSHFMTHAASGRRRSAEEEDADLRLANDLANFSAAEADGKAMSVQKLGGQIIRHDGSGDESGKPLYFIGAFKGSELHLSQIAGTVQLRPHFHHLDAEETQNRLLAREASATTSSHPDSRPRIVHQSYKSGPPGGSGNPKGELEEQSANLSKALREAAEEKFVRCGYVDEYEDVAFETFRERLFLKEGGVGSGKVLKASMGKEEWLDAMTAPAMRRGARRVEKWEEGEEG